MIIKILIIGYAEYQGRHFESLQNIDVFEIVFSNTYSITKIEELNFVPDIVIVTDEHYCELANIVNYFKEKSIPTLHLMDGILEWRRTWDYQYEGNSVNEIRIPINQPVFSDKIACLGYKDYRILESWGNKGKCEIVGLPRLDYLKDKRINRTVEHKKNKRVLVATAKTPGFTKSQTETTIKSLIDLKKYFESRNDIEVIWRITNNLYNEIGIQENTLSNLNGQELHAILQTVDAVITTPSTTILEAMYLNIPVATLDYHNKPHYIETTWSIYSQNQIATVVAELLTPKQEFLDYQEFLLNDQLQINQFASKRLIELIKKMVYHKRNNMQMPYSILDNSYYSNLILSNNLGIYYKNLESYDTINNKQLKLELVALKGVLEIIDKKNVYLEKKLNYSITFRVLKAIKNFIKK